MRVLFSIAFWCFFAASCVVLFLVALAIFVATLPFDPNGRAVHLFSCFWAQVYFYVNPFWRMRVEGRDRIPWRGAAVLVANHQSLGDILVLYGLYRPFKWVSKRSVFRVPFMGWNMRLNRYVEVIRGDRASVTRMMAACERWIDRGVPVLFFPEGTRSPDGEVQAFKDGAFTLAAAKGCPVIPIVVTGTAAALPKRGIVLRGRVDSTVRVLDPVDPHRFGGDAAALRDHVRGLIVQAKRQMEAHRAAAVGGRDGS